MGKSNEYPLSFRLPKELLERLDKFCAEYYMKRPDAIRMALITFLKAHDQAGTLLPSIMENHAHDRKKVTYHSVLKTSGGD